MSTGARSKALLERAARVIPGGVNSPVRAFKSVGGSPLFIERGEGPFLFDADGKRYIDYVGSWGPLVLGHGSQVVDEAIRKALPEGTTFGAPTEREVEFAELITQLIPSVEMLRMVSSGTEATMSAIRLARGYTKRDRIIKFNGCYHGHADSLLVKAGSGVATLGIAGSPGVPTAIAELSVSIEFNDAELLRETLEALGPETVAAIIIEPVPGNMGLILPRAGYLEAVSELCRQHGIVLIFDEVMTGFRVGLGGAQELYGIEPDLTTFGKVVGGGLPVGVFGGRREIMSLLAPLGPVYQAGTLSGNPLAVAAGLAVLKQLHETNPYPQLTESGCRFARGLRQAAEECGVALQTSSCGSMIGLFFSEKPVTSFSEALRSDVPRFNKFFWGMLERGVYLAPSAFEAGFISTVHSDALIDETIAAARDVFRTL
ncbi:MAG: glutamate-1-semialdehyde 2,1-aminomutase [Bdellovibrionota bacterium]